MRNLMMAASVLTLLAPRVHSRHIEPLPTTNAEFAQLMARISYTNQTLLDYFFPAKPEPNAVWKNYWTQTAECHMRPCWCMHVSGSRDRTVNPDPPACEGGMSGDLMKRQGTMTKSNCHKRAMARKCHCLTGSGKPCLATSMNPGTLVSAIALMRAGGINHIIEEGRENGLTAFMYKLHGFKVTSVEYGPIDEVSLALRDMAPDIKLVDGDGSVLIPEIVGNMTDRQAARTMIFFDGEKRVFAHRTLSKVRDRVAAAAFDDSIPAFQEYLNQQNQIWWQVGAEPLYGPMLKLIDAARKHYPNGRTPQAKGAEDIFGTTLFQFGGAWGRFGLG
mmetsp:Transcript_14544/g.37686  ORF Transcript_14544/g.37686 Transcript_14544/m.37686 type:complete len:332 (+) Transcript_14544:94-1089(+)